MPPLKRARGAAPATKRLCVSSLPVKVSRQDLDTSGSSVATEAHRLGARLKLDGEPPDYDVTPNTDGTVTLHGKAAKKALKDVGENDPGVLLTFDPDVVNAAVARANVAQPPLAAWMPLGTAYPLTAGQLQRMIVGEISLNAGGLVPGTCLLAPNTLHQSYLVRDRIAYLMTDAFLLAVANAPLARVHVFADRQHTTTGVPMPVVVPRGVAFVLFV